MLLSEFLRHAVHYGLHLVFPVWIGKRFYPVRWRRAYAILLATMLIDLDHLLANPIFDPDRCSVGFHLLHQPWAIACYVAFLCWPATRLAGIGLVLHILTDMLDCWLRAASA